MFTLNLKTMKVLLLIVCVCIGVSQQINFDKALDDFEDVIDKEAKECYYEFKLQRPQLDAILKMNNLPNDRNFKCYLACLFSHLNIIDGSFNMLTDNIKTYLDVDENFDKAIVDFEDVVDKEAKECYNEFHFNRQQLESMLKMVDLPNDRNLKCYLACLYIHINIVDESFNRLTENAKQYYEVDKPTADLIYNKCKDLKGEDNCEKAFTMTNCVREYLKSL
ncbi:hypothetical protein FQA39_LY03437 [Lamprigera yunnana]|nr:hypothetical protein FQA39_LY03437 [Lamprigera yunnana]